jgi:UPF0042 nucleotide-binding protein
LLKSGLSEALSQGLLYGTMTEINLKSQEGARVILVTGVSGAGKSSALKTFEDMGYEAIDNVPISLIDRLISPGGFEDHTAIGIDIRTRDFNAKAVLKKIAGLVRRQEADIDMVFLDCEDDILVRRYEETRRRHPLALDRPVLDGIRQERMQIEALRERASLLIDTSDMKLGDLKRTLDGQFGLNNVASLSVFISSFGFKYGLLRDADLVFDVRFLKNPYYDIDLRLLSGKDKIVQDYIASDDGFDLFFEHLLELLNFLLDRYEAEGKSYLTIAIGCTGGQHRSVFAAEWLARSLKGYKYPIQVKHRDIHET